MWPRFLSRHGSVWIAEMSLTSTQIALLLDEVSPRLANAWIQKVWCRNDLAFMLEFRVPGRNDRLTISLEDRAVRLHLEVAKPQQPPHPTDFVMLLRKHLVGRRVVGIEQVGGDRVLRLAAEDEGRARRTVVAEFTGRHGNVFLLDQNDKILGSLLPNRSFRRKLVLGEPYVLPAARPASVSGRSGDDLALAALPADGSRSEAVCRFYTQRVAHDAALRRVGELLRSLRRETAATKRRRARIDDDLRQAADAQKYRKYGELLQSAHGRIPRGATAIDVPDYYDEAMRSIRIPLDPRVDLKANIERYFRRYRKFSSAKSRIEGRLAAAEERLATLQPYLAEVESLEKLVIVANSSALLVQALEGLERLESEVTRSLRLKPRRRQGLPRKRAEPRRALPYRKFESATGKTILVGKGGRHNDSLTLRVARGNDLWLHAHDWAGAHVVVRLDRGEEPDPETLLDAAHLAAHFSKARRAGKLEVLHTRAKHVSKGKGAPPGRVNVASSRTLLIQKDEERLARLLNRPAP